MNSSTNGEKQWPTPRSAGLEETLESFNLRNDVIAKNRAKGPSGMPLNVAVQKHWPTPAAALLNDAESPETFMARAAYWAKEKGYFNSTPLTIAVKMEKNCPTPHSNMTTGAGTQGRDGGMNIQTAVAEAQKDWPTPTCNDASNNGGPAQWERVTIPLNCKAGGRLNPSWVEQLMGWENGWTALPTEAYGRLRKASRSTRGKRRGPSSNSSKDAPTD